MHEMSIAMDLLDQVETVRVKNFAKKIVRIELAMGPLSGVEPDLLTRAFSIVRVGTAAEKAEITYRVPPVRVLCQSCGIESDAPPNKLLCSQCNDWHVTVTSGEDMLLERIELSFDAEEIEEPEPCVRLAAAV